MHENPPTPILEDAEVLRQDLWPGGYHLLELRAAGIASRVQPGQFVHLRLFAPADLVLRRPFSVFQADGEALRLLYKVVGRGTEAMTRLRAGEGVSLLGPLGRGFPPPARGVLPVLVAGGYGAAALYLQAAACPQPGWAFVGGAGAEDVLCTADFERLGWTVRIATEDGSLGVEGQVTLPLDEFLFDRARPSPIELFACGPDGLLQAVAERARRHDVRAWISMDRRMGCGVGACLTCVQKVRAPDGSGVWARVCKEGPVFDAADVVWEAEP